MNRTEKQEIVDGLTDRLSGAAGLYLADFTGIAVGPMTELRRKLRSAGVEFVVVKNTLARRALEAASVEGLDDQLTGPTGFAFCDDPLEAAKVFSEFQKEHEQLTVKAGLVDGRPVDAVAVQRLASLPSRDQLLGQVAGLMQAPLQGFAGAVGALLYQFVGVLDSLRANRETA